MAREALARGEHGAIAATHTARGWKARAYWRDQWGERQEMCRYADTRKAAVKRLEQALDEVLAVGKGGEVRDTDTLREVAKVWLERLEKEDLSKETKRAYRSMVRKHILDEETAQLQGLQIRKITPGKLGDALDEIGETCGPGAAKSMRTIYRNVLDLAVRYDALPINPARALPPRRRKGVVDDEDPMKGRSLTDAEREDILGKLSKDKWAADQQLQTLMRVLAGTGMRIGEAIRLNWDDILWKEGQIQVPGTKSVNAPRVVAAPDWLMAALRKRHKELSPAGDSPVCPSPFGKRRDSSNSVRSVSRWLDKNGYPWATSHTFRRTVATRLDDAGLTPRQIAVHLGHADPAITMGTYMDRKVIVEQAAEHL